MDKGIFLKAKDFALLSGNASYDTCCKRFQRVKREMNKVRQVVSIKEYCDFYHLDFDFVWKLIRGE